MCYWKMIRLQRKDNDKDEKFDRKYDDKYLDGVLVRKVMDGRIKPFFAILQIKVFWRCINGPVMQGVGFA